MEKKDIYRLPRIVLFVLAGFDFLRGFMHTFNIHWAAAHVAKLDLSAAANDQLWLLATFGISNYVSGALLLLIALKAKALSPYAVVSLPAMYLLGFLGFRFAGLHRGAAEFNGLYFMMMYWLVCILTFVIFVVQKRKQS